MNKHIPQIILIIVCIIIIAVASFFVSKSYNKSEQSMSDSSGANTKNAMTLTLSSSAFSNNGSIPSKYTCDGENIIPPLSISGVDPGARSLALIMDDPDAASVVGHTFDHWVIFNIDPKTTEIKEGQSPKGVTGQNGSGKSAYTGPCPPNGLHHYHFKLYSLNDTLREKEGATKAEVEASMEGQILQQAELIGVYNRAK